MEHPTCSDVEDVRIHYAVASRREVHSCRGGVDGVSRDVVACNIGVHLDSQTHARVYRVVVDGVSVRGGSESHSIRRAARPRADVVVREHAVACSLHVHSVKRPCNARLDVVVRHVRGFAGYDVKAASRRAVEVVVREVVRTARLGCDVNRLRRCTHDVAREKVAVGIVENEDSVIVHAVSCSDVVVAEIVAQGILLYLDRARCSGSNAVVDDVVVAGRVGINAVTGGAEYGVVGNVVVVRASRNPVKADAVVRRTHDVVHVERVVAGVVVGVNAVIACAVAYGKVAVRNVVVVAVVDVNPDVLPALNPRVVVLYHDILGIFQINGDLVYRSRTLLEHAVVHG